jgi:phosphate transport system permease protein
MVHPFGRSYPSRHDSSHDHLHGGGSHQVDSLYLSGGELWFRGTRWQTIRHSVLPHALPGILTGAILGLGRAAGETAPILFTVAAFYLPRLPRSVFDQVMALPYHLYVISTQVPNMPTRISFATALVLIILVFLMNLVSIVLRAHYRKKKQW